MPEKKKKETIIQASPDVHCPQRANLHGFIDHMGRKWTPRCRCNSGMIQKINLTTKLFCPLWRPLLFLDHLTFPLALSGQISLHRWQMSEAYSHAMKSSQFNEQLSGCFSFSFLFHLFFFRKTRYNICWKETRSKKKKSAWNIHRLSSTSQSTYSTSNVVLTVHAEHEKEDPSEAKRVGVRNEGLISEAPKSLAAGCSSWINKHNNVLLFEVNYKLGQ